MSDFHDRIVVCHRCDFKEPPPHRGRVACTIDGKDISEHSQAQECPRDFYRNPPPVKRSAAPDTSCTHRGDQAGEVECETCTGKVMLKTFACALHERCVVARNVPGVKTCSTCSDRNPEPKDPP